MRVVNRARSTVLADRAVVADTFGARLRGLMFRDEFPEGTRGLILTPCNAIHTFFMRFSIDVIFLDRSGLALYCVENAHPRQVLLGPGGTHTVLELPVGMISYSGTRPRDQLDFIFAKRRCGL